MQHASCATTAAAICSIISPFYRQTLLAMIEDLEKRKPEAIDWFTNDLENVGLVAKAAGFSPNAVYQAISYPLWRGELNEVLARLKDVRAMLASE